MRTMMRRALRGAKADYCELRLERTDALHIAHRGRAMETVYPRQQYGGCARALHRGGWGFSAFSDGCEMTSAVRRACAAARITGRLPGARAILAPVQPVEDDFVPDIAVHPRDVDMRDKARLIEGYAGTMLGEFEEIVAANIPYRERDTEVYYATTEGTSLRQERIDVGCDFEAAAARDGLTVSHKMGVGSSRGFACMLNLEENLRDTARTATHLLEAPPIRAGQYAVVCDPGLAGLFVHEAFGHLSEADNAHRNPELARTMRSGRQLGRKILSIYDTGEYFADRGALRFDDEGVPARSTALIEEGILVGRLHSRETAGRLGETPTGNARALDYTHPPICRMRSTCIAPGETSLSDMVRGVERGLYAIGSRGGQTNGEVFTFQAGYGYIIRDGQLAELVRDVSLMGNVFTTLMQIDRVGCDPVSRNSSGGCGKAGQGPLPTSGVNPHIRIRDVTVGGAG